MLSLEYTEMDGLWYPNIKTSMQDMENDWSKYGIMRLRYLHEHKCVYIFSIKIISYTGYKGLEQVNFRYALADLK